MKNVKFVIIISICLVLLKKSVYSDDANPVKFLRFPFQHQQSQLMNNYGRWFDSLNVRFVGNWPFGNPYAVASDTVRNLVFFSCGGGVYIYDFSNPSAPIKLSEKIHTRSRFAYDLFYDMPTQRLYTAGGWSNQNEIWDVSNLSNPVKLGGWNTQYFSWEVFVSGSYAYVADGAAGLRIINISNPSNPYEVSYNNTIGYAYHVVVSDSYAYVVSDSLFIFNVSDQANPYIVGHYNANGWILVVDTLAYMTGSQFRILNVSDPVNPYEVGHYSMPCSGISLTDSIAYIIFNYYDIDSLYIFNISDPINPYIVSRCDSTLGDVYGMGLLNSHLYIADAYSKLHIVDVSNSVNPLEEDFLSATGPAFGVGISDSFAYVAEDISGLRIINVSDPANPYEAGYYDTPGHAMCITVSGSYAYVADYDSSLRIINISNPLNTYEVGHLYTPTNDAEYVAYRNPYAYVISIFSGLRIINVADPGNPFEVGYFDTPGYTTWVTIVDSLAYVTGFINLETSFLYIINISNPSNPYEIGHCAIQGCSNGIVVSGGYAYIASGLDGLRIINISDPSNPYEAGYLIIPECYLSGIDISGSLVYVVDYRNLYLHIINISDPVSPQVIGYYETPDNPFGITLAGRYILVADCCSGLQIYESYDNNLDESSNTSIYKNLQFLQNPIKNGCIDLELSLSQANSIKFSIYNAAGQKVQTFYKAFYQSGWQKIKLPVKDLRSGIYFLHMRINDIQTTGKIILIK